MNPKNGIETRIGRRSEISEKSSRPRREREAASAPILALLHRASQAVDSVFDRESSLDGPTACQQAVMVAVAQGDRLSQTDICERTGIDRSTLAEVVRRLVKRGLLQRKRTKTDARRYEVTVTSQGLAVLKAGVGATGRTEARIAQILDARERKLLSEMLLRLGEIGERAAQASN